MQTPPDKIRNIGIISHIDAGKTTVSERILFYSGETHKMGEVHDGAAVMDWMPQEQERGITITASATTCHWRDVTVNLIDTPGHIDFTIEVERSMRVLDGAIAIFSAVEGVQPQSESVWRQAERYRVPRICFINKMDRVGADLEMVLERIRQRLKARPVLLEIPLGSESRFAGIIDLLTEEAVTFSETDQGQTMLRSAVPGELCDAVSEAREHLVEAAADFDDDIMADYLSGNRVGADRLVAALRRGTLACAIFPVLLGTALRNKGIQPLLDAVAAYLPSPLDTGAARGTNPVTGAEEEVACDSSGPLRALAFKVQADEGRKLTYLRIYSGMLRTGDPVFNSSRNRTEKIGRMFRMHSHRREQIDCVAAGDIVAAGGLKEALTGDTLCDPHHPLVLEGMTVPDPVVSLAVEAKGADDRERLPAALEKLLWEDPTFRVHEDPDTGQTILTGMGELHLEIIIDRLVREFGVQVKTGAPRVVYRETIEKKVEHREYFQRDVDGRVQKGEALLRLSPLKRGSGVRVVLPPPDRLPLSSEQRRNLQTALLQSCEAGCMTGYPLADLEVRLLDAPYEPGTTTELGLRAAAQKGLIMAARSARVFLLEPVMALELTVPAEAAGKVLGALQQKRGRVEGIENRDDLEIIRALAPLAGMFGYMSELRSATKGRGSYTMEFSHFDRAPQEVQRQFGLV
jgi:elongation factor G